MTRSKPSAGAAAGSRERPSILELEPRRERASPRATATARSACALAIQLAALYPARRVFLLGRDMEYHRDVLLLLHAAGRVASAPRLLEVSRESARDPLLRDYCRQQGLGHGPAVIADSGVSGNVVTAIRGALPDADIAGVLIYSENPAYPGSEAAFAPLGASMRASPYERRTTLEHAVEQLPRFHPKAVGYAVDDGRVAPRRASERARPEQRRQTLAFMAALAAALERHVEEGCWRAERHAIGHLVGALDGGVGRERRIVVPLAAFGPDENGGVAADAVYALRDLELAAQDRLKDPNLVLELDAAGAAAGVVASAERLVGRLVVRAPGRVRLSAALRTRSADQPPETLNAQQVVAWLWDRLDAERRDRAPIELVSRAVEAVSQLPNGVAWLRDVLEAATRRKSDRALRADAVGAVWEVVGEAVRQPRSAAAGRRHSAATGVRRRRASR